MVSAQAGVVMGHPDETVDVTDVDVIVSDCSVDVTDVDEAVSDCSEAVEGSSVFVGSSV